MRQRDVFFVHGFEKRSAVHQRLWQRREALKWARMRGLAVKVGQIEAAEQGYARWTLSAPGITTRFHLFDWSDIVAERMRAPLGVVLSDAVFGLFRALAQGIFGKIRRRDWALWVMLLVGFGPVGISLMLLILTFVLRSPGLGVAALVACVVTLLMLGIGQRSPVRYILDIAWGARRIACGDLVSLKKRVSAFEAKAQAAVADGSEVIIVGHSLGAALALDVASQLPRGTFLSVGQSISLVTTQKEAARNRQAMEQITIPWIDVSAGRDVLGFDGYDPSSGKARCFPARFLRAFDPKEIRADRFSGYRMHFQYFRANKQGGLPWDWFDVLLGEPELPQRFAQEEQMSGRGNRRLPL